MPDRQNEPLGNGLDITEAMRAAGAEVLLDLLGEDVSDFERASRVYAAMREASGERSSASPTSR